MKKYSIICIIFIISILIFSGFNAFLGTPNNEIGNSFSDTDIVTDDIPDLSIEETNTDTTPSQNELLTSNIFKTKYISVKTNALNVRKGAGTEYESICSFNKGDMVCYLGKQGDWYVTYSKGMTGYISANPNYTELKELKSSTEQVEKVILEGTKYLGTKYVYGATRYITSSGTKIKDFSSNAFDCSSLMQYIFYVGNGNILGLTTREQVIQGDYISKYTLKRGDLMFFTNSSRFYKTGIERVGHVALYLGDNYILHTASDYAVIEQISDARWGYFLEARRII